MSATGAPAATTAKPSSTTSTKPDFPLTTIFTPPPSCVSRFTKSGSLVWQGGIMQTVDNGCFPPNFLGIFNSAFSPGVCPQGWTSAASLDSPNTNMMCCPRGYFMTRKTFDPAAKNPSDGGLFCASTVASTATLTEVYITTTLKAGAVPTAGQTAQAVAGAAIADGLVWQDIIQVRWDSRDGGVLSLMREQASSEAAFQSSLTAKPSTTAAQTSQSAQTSAASVEEPASSGVSGGVIAGAVIGALAGLILGGIAMWFCLKKRKQRREEVAYGATEKPYGGPPAGAELAASVPREIDGSPSTAYASTVSPGHAHKLSHSQYAPSHAPSDSYTQYGQSPQGPAPAYAYNKPAPPLPEGAPVELPASDGNWKR